MVEFFGDLVSFIDIRPNPNQYCLVVKAHEEYVLVKFSFTKTRPCPFLGWRLRLSSSPWPFIVFEGYYLSLHLVYYVSKKLWDAKVVDLFLVWDVVLTWLHGKGKLISVGGLNRCLSIEIRFI